MLHQNKPDSGCFEPLAFSLFRSQDWRKQLAVCFRCTIAGDLVFFVGGGECGMYARAKKKLGHLRRLSGSPQVCFGQASVFECGMPSISTISSQFLSLCKNVKDLARAPGAGFAIVRIWSLASLAFCSKRQQKATPQGWNFGLHLGSPSTPRRKARARAHTHNTQFWKPCN